MAYGKQAARSLDLQLMEINRWDKIFPVFEYEQTPPEEPSPNHRHNGHIIAPSARARCNAEVVTGLIQEEALDESCRCLRCDVKAAEPS
jgi:hypothetical protein